LLILPAKTFSIDKSSGEKGGDRLGTFGRGTMIPAFDDVVFNGKKGDIKVFTTTIWCTPYTN
jgi:peptidyl-prolyl cis-trans isomerase D